MILPDRYSVQGGASSTIKMIRRGTRKGREKRRKREEEEQGTYLRSQKEL